MRNKIKQLMKKEGGFTLIELLGVIVILGIIVAISIPLIGNVITNAETSTEASQKELVIDAARLYFMGEKIDGGTVDEKALVENGYLEEKSQNDEKNTNYEVTKTGNKYTIK